MDELHLIPYRDKAAYAVFRGTAHIADVSSMAFAQASERRYSMEQMRSIGVSYPGAEPNKHYTGEAHVGGRTEP